MNQKFDGFIVRFFQWLTDEYKQLDTMKTLFFRGGEAWVFILGLAISQTLTQAEATAPGNSSLKTSPQILLNRAKISNRNFSLDEFERVIRTLEIGGLIFVDPKKGTAGIRSQPANSIPGAADRAVIRNFRTGNNEQESSSTVFFFPPESRVEAGSGRKPDSFELADLLVAATNLTGQRNNQPTETPPSDRLDESIAHHHIAPRHWSGDELPSAAFCLRSLWIDLTWVNLEANTLKNLENLAVYLKSLQKEPQKQLEQLVLAAALVNTVKIKQHPFNKLLKEEDTPEISAIRKLLERAEEVLSELKTQFQEEAIKMPVATLWEKVKYTETRASRSRSQGITDVINDILSTLPQQVRHQVSPSSYVETRKTRRTGNASSTDAMQAVERSLEPNESELSTRIGEILASLEAQWKGKPNEHTSARIGVPPNNNQFFEVAVNFRDDVMQILAKRNGPFVDINLPLSSPSVDNIELTIRGKYAQELERDLRLMWLFEILAGHRNSIGEAISAERKRRQEVMIANELADRQLKNTRLVTSWLGDTATVALNLMDLSEPINGDIQQAGSYSVTIRDTAAQIAITQGDQTLTFALDLESGEVTCHSDNDLTRWQTLVQLFSEITNDLQQQDTEIVTNPESAIELPLRYQLLFATLLLSPDETKQALTANLPGLATLFSKASYDKPMAIRVKRKTQEEIHLIDIANQGNVINLTPTKIIGNSLTLDIDHPLFLQLLSDFASLNAIHNLQSERQLQTADTENDNPKESEPSDERILSLEGLLALPRIGRRMTAMLSEKSPLAVIGIQQIRFRETPAEDGRYDLEVYFIPAHPDLDSSIRIHWEISSDGKPVNPILSWSAEQFEGKTIVLPAIWRTDVLSALQEALTESVRDAIIRIMQGHSTTSTDTSTKSPSSRLSLSEMIDWWQSQYPDKPIPTRDPGIRWQTERDYNSMFSIEAISDVPVAFKNSWVDFLKDELTWQMKRQRITTETRLEADQELTITRVTQIKPGPRTERLWQEVYLPNNILPSQSLLPDHLLPERLEDLVVEIGNDETISLIPTLPNYWKIAAWWVLELMNPELDQFAREEGLNHFREYIASAINNKRHIDVPMPALSDPRSAQEWFVAQACTMGEAKIRTQLGSTTYEQVMVSIPDTPKTPALGDSSPDVA